MHSVSQIEADTYAALSFALASAGKSVPAPASSVRTFWASLESSEVNVHPFVARSGGRIVAAAVLMEVPGRVGVILTATDTPPIEQHAQQKVLHEAIAHAAQLKLHFLQAALEPDDQQRRATLSECGFRLLTTLHYLTAQPAVSEQSSADEDGAWLPFAPEHFDLFARVVTQSYEGSADCPELSELRPASDALRAHRAAGLFDAALWKLRIEGGQPAGCLLLARSATVSALELAYMGVVPAARGRGVGACLLREAHRLAVEARAQALTLAVDERNTVAARLYARFGFTAWARRVVLLLTHLESGGAGRASRCEV